MCSRQQVLQLSICSLQLKSQIQRCIALTANEVIHKNNVVSYLFFQCNSVEHRRQSRRRQIEIDKNLRHVTLSGRFEVISVAEGPCL